MTGGVAAAHADGQGAGAGESRRAAICHHDGQEILGPVLAGESAPACDNAGCVI